MLTRAPDTVTCPSCGALRGSPCVDPRGNKATATHKARERLAAKLAPTEAAP